MRDWTLATYLERLAAPRPPTPAGGVVAALSLAQAAGLLTMVARIAGGPDDVLTRAPQLKERALELVEADVRAFDAVTVEVARSRDDPGRAAAISAALVAAAGPPAQVVELGCEAVGMAERLSVIAGRTVLADVAAAAEAAAAAVAISRTNVESNVRGAPHGPDVTRLREGLAPVDEVLARAAALREAVRGRVG